MDILRKILLLQAASTLLYVALKLRRTKRSRNRRWWVHPINQLREQKGHFQHLIQELKLDEELFFNYTRMNLNLFNYLLEKITPKLTKTSFRAAILPEERLIITLRYLATGDEISSIALAYRVGRSTVRYIIKETCLAIIDVLRDEYLPVPSTNDWKTIADGFYSRWNIPNCVGAVDGKHIVIEAPPNSGSQFMNYKKTFSIVLMAICDHDYTFTIFDIGANGCQNDAGIFSDTWFGMDIYNKCEALKIPSAEFQLPGTEESTPLYFVGDGAFALSPHLMKPYPGLSLLEEKKIFNYRLSRGRRIIENTFGILSARWRVLRKSINALPANADGIVMACVSLHNYLRKNQSVQYCPPGLADEELPETGEIIPGSWRVGHATIFQDLENSAAHRSTNCAYSIRNKLTQYFIGANGQVPWQYDYVRQGTNRHI